MSDQKGNPQELSEEDKKILADAHANKDNPEHPAHKEHPHHGEWMKKVGSKLGNAFTFGDKSDTVGDGDLADTTYQVQQPEQIS